MTPQSSAELRAHGVWVLERLGGLTDDDVNRFAADSAPLVRTHLARALAERTAWTEVVFGHVRKMLGDENAIVRRVAADALGRHPHVANVAALFELLSDSPANDTHLVHVATSHCETN